jgi:cation:H+ antiporter
MVIVFSLALLVGGALLLIKGADWFMDGIEDVAKVWGISLFVLGVILAGLEPEEMLTAAIASGRGDPALAIGNVLGTNITMVTAALGLSALIFPIILDHSVRRQALTATAISLPPITLLCFGGNITRIAGVCLLVLFIGYTIFLLRTDRSTRERMEALEKLEDDDDDDDDDDSTIAASTTKNVWRPLAFTLGGLLAMALGGPAIVQGAEGLTQTIGLSQQAIGATLVSLATGSEIIVLGVTAARKKQSEVLIGGILGSFSYNLLVTMGLAAVIRPLLVNIHDIAISLSSLVIVHLILLFLIWHGRISRITGVFFLILYAIYLAITLLIGFNIISAI